MRTPPRTLDFRSRGLGGPRSTASSFLSLAADRTRVKPPARRNNTAGGDAYSAIMHAQPLSAPTPPRSYIHPASVITTRLGGHGKQCDSAQQPGSSKEEGCALHNSKFYLVRLN